MSSNRKKLTLSSVTVKLGCDSCSFRRRRRLKLKLFFSSIFHSNPKPKTTRTSSSSYYSSSTSFFQTTTNTTFSPATLYSDDDNYTTKSSRSVQGFGRIGGESLAVEKDSDDPYLDFRQSMLQMILEKEIYSKEDLKELLNCFLHLNSTYHHGIIVRAFTDIWNGLYSVNSGGYSKLLPGGTSLSVPKSHDF